jgi:predicted HicB family RNase H-like nuclease
MVVAGLWWHGGGMKKPVVRDALTLRLPPKLHRHLKAKAVDNGRSLNAEIVQRLQRTVEDANEAQAA